MSLQMELLLNMNLISAEGFTTESRRTQSKNELRVKTSSVFVSPFG
jgi:hypothetical protein